MRNGLGVPAWRRVAASVTAVVLLGAGVGGCDDGSAEPSESGLPSEAEMSASDPTPRPEPTSETPGGPTPPELPKLARSATKAGAKAFVAYYLELLNYAAHTGDVAPIRRNSTPGCQACREEARGWEQLYANGGWAKGGELSITRLRAMTPAQPEDVYVGVTVARAEGRFKAGPNAPVKTVPADVADLDYYLVRVRGGWKMARGEMTQ